MPKIKKLKNAWLDDSIQFPRLLDECRAVVTMPQIREIAVSMSLTMHEVIDLFDRAEKKWEKIKAKV